MDAPADEAGDPAVAMHLDRRLLLLWGKSGMDFCTQSVEPNEVIQVRFSNGFGFGMLRQVAAFHYSTKAVSVSLIAVLPAARSKYRRVCLPSAEDSSANSNLFESVLSPLL